MKARLVTTIAALVVASLPVDAWRAPALAPVTEVDAVGITVGDMDRALAFYTGVLPFKKVSDVEVSGRAHELLTGVFGARLRIVRLQLGDEAIELMAFKAPPGRPYPPDTRANDRWFQHIAIIVSDMDRAYAHLEASGVAHASTGPQRLPDWNQGAGGIQAHYFRDPDGHFLEILSFPADKGDARWHRAEAAPPLFLGIDHTAIVTSDTSRALEFYNGTLGLRIAGAGVNYGVEQEHLNNVFGVRLRITTLRAPAGPGIELLDYLTPGDGRPAPIDLRANDLAHWQTTLVTRGLTALFDLSLAKTFRLVSPDVVSIADGRLGFRRAALVRDLDGHAMRLVER
ncbi:MAG TPA: VOC family protein [Vicinamibacterales bacterium]|nr:VOC family protein [Vicinamibacterales bacterium]